MQGAVGILVTPDSGELINLPEDKPEENIADVRYELKLSNRHSAWFDGGHRTGAAAIDDDGKLQIQGSDSQA